MAIIKPFKAVRPARDKVASVTSRSFDEYSEKELAAILNTNPFSFLQIINPGLTSHKKVYGAERYTLIHNRYLEFLEDNVLIKDRKEGIYLYQIEKNQNNYCGFFCATSVEDYRNNVIKKHEDTLSKREQLFASYLNIVEFNAEPVLMTFPDNATIRQLFTEITKNSTDYGFTSPDGTKHSLWVVADTGQIVQLQQAFKEIGSLYIADGHHRSASSELLARKRKVNNPSHTGKEGYNFFMSYLIPESEIRIYGYNRMVKDLNGLSKNEFLVRLEALFSIEKKGNSPYTPSKKHHFCMYLDGAFYSLVLRKGVYEFKDPLSKLDTQILYKTILEPILGITDLRTDKRIRYVYGKHNMHQVKDEIDKGNYEVGFGLVPQKIEEIKAIADAGLVMPPKSTYIEPKLRSGLAIYEF